jgi:hypothetical protein
MAAVDKGTISNNALPIAFATENPVRAKINGAYVLITFTTDLADFAEGFIQLTWATGFPHAEISWPSSVRWDGNGQKPNPEPEQPVRRQSDGNVPADAGTSIFKFIRSGTEYFGRMVVAGSPAL